MKGFPFFVILTLLGGASLNSAVPATLPHQGRVAVNGVNFDGAGSFKFLLFTDADASHASGNEIALWKNDDPTPANMNEPVSAVPLLVTKGLYAVQLGDAPQAVLPASLVPPAGRRVYLRIWFDNGVNGLQQLTPDQELAAVPFARHAETASGFSGNLNLGTSSVTAQTMLIGQPGQPVTMTSYPATPDRLNVVGDLEVEGTGESRFLGNVEIENQLVVGTVNSNLSPHVDNALDLGISVKRWRQLVLGPMGLSIGDSGDLATLSFNPATDLLSISRDTRVGGRLMWGDATEAAGIGATAWGATSLASGDLSTAWGNETKAGGTESSAWGRLTLASGEISTAWGREVIAPSYLETALGQFNTEYTRNSAVAWDPADRLFVIGNGTNDANRSDALVILKNGAASFGGAVSVAGDLNVTGAVNYGSLNLPANVMLEGESLGLLNNDAGFLASPGGTVAVPETEVHTGSTAHVSGKNYDGILLEGISQMAAHPAGIVASYLPATQELVFLNRHASGVYEQILRLSSPSQFYEYYTIANTDGLAQIAMDPAGTFDNTTSMANMAFVLSSANKVRAARLKFIPGYGFYPGGLGGNYEDDSVNPSSPFSHLQGPIRAALHDRVLAVISSEQAVTFINTDEYPHESSSRLAVHVASPTMPITNPADVVVGEELAAVAALGTETVQLFGIDRAATVSISVKGKITDGENGFTRIQNPNLLAFNHGSLLAISSTTENAITLADVSDAGSPQPFAVIEGSAVRMIFQNPTTLVVLRSGHISVLDVSAPGNPVEKMRLTPQNTPGLVTGNSSGMGMAQPGELALGAVNEVSFYQLDAPAATQSLTVSGWLALGGVERAYAPLHVQGNVLVDDAEYIRLDSERLQSTAENIALGNGASVTNEGVAIGSNAQASDGGTAVGQGAKASGLHSVAIGGNAQALGDLSFAIGNTVFAKSYMETVMGANSTFAEPLSATSWNPLDRLFVIGNGDNGFSDALVMLKNGNTTLNGSLTVNGATTINGSLHLTGAVTGGGLALLGAANVFTQDVTTQADYKYAAPKTGKVRVHARAFAPASWFTSRNVDYAFDNAFLYLEDNPNGTARFNAGVDLPAGAVITKVGLHYMDAETGGTGGDDNFDAFLSLRYFDQVTGNEGGVASIPLVTTGIDGDIKTEEVILNHTVSENRAYGLQFRMTNCAGNDLRFYGVTIEYQTTTVQP